jgi:hypothetical protein
MRTDSQNDKDARAIVRRQGGTMLAAGVVLVAVAMFVPGGACVFMPIGMVGLLLGASGVLLLKSASV